MTDVMMSLLIVPIDEENSWTRPVRGYGCHTCIESLVGQGRLQPSRVCGRGRRVSSISSRRRVSAFAQSAQCERFSQFLFLAAYIAAAQLKSFSLQQFYLAIEWQGGPSQNRHNSC